MSIRSFYKKYSTRIWVVIALCTWFIFQVTDVMVMDKWYRSGLFSCLRTGFDHTLSLLPFSPGILFITYAFVWLVRKIRRPFNCKSFSLKFIRLVCLVYTSFYWLWGFNYGCPDVSSILKWEQQEASIDSLYALFDIEVQELSKLKANQFIINNHDAVLNTCRNSLAEVLVNNGYTVSGKPKIRVVPKGLFLRNSTAGMYNPFFGEGYIDEGLHDLEKPFVIAHELSHAYGITDEGEANFWGLLTCLHSSDSYIQYAGRLGLFRYILSDMRKANRDDYRSKWETIPTSIKNDLEEINENHKKYPDILPKLRNAVYDFYLQSNRVAQGLNSYNRVINYYLSWKLSQSNAQSR